MKRLEIDSLIQAIRDVVSPTSLATPLSLHEPLFNGNEWKYLKDCLDTGWVSSVGKYVDLFEIELARYTGVKKAVAVVNGTMALHVCLKLVGVEANDEVLIPTLTFVATANAVQYCAAIPHFIDSEETTLGVDPSKLENYLDRSTEMRGASCYNKNSNRRIKALVAMHTFGHPVDLDPLVRVCKKYNIELIEDAAESLGSYYKGKHTGHHGRISALSFNGNKVMTTGGGGAILTNDEDLGILAKHLTTTAKIPHKWAFIHDQVGFNYRLPNLNAALGCAQLEQLDSFLKRKRNLTSQYGSALAGIGGVRLFTEASFAKSNYWLNTLLIDESFSSGRDEVLEAMHQANILARPAWVLMHKLPMYNKCPKMDLSKAENLEKRIINIPSSPKLSR